MDNASKALMISAEVMLGVLILAVGIYFLRALSNFGNTTIFRSKELEKIQEFNAPLESFINAVNEIKTNEYTSSNTGNNGQSIKSHVHRVNIGDVLSVMNYARNVNLELYDDLERDFIDMKVNGKDLSYYYKNEPKFKTKYSEEMYEFIESFAVNINKEGEFPNPDPLKIDIEPNSVTRDVTGKITGMKIKIDR